MNDHPFTQQWLANLSQARSQNPRDQPNYWRQDPKTLISFVNIHKLSLGTGESIYASSIIPAIEAADQEVLLVTCFWARSKTLEALRHALRNLSAKGQRNGRAIRVRMYFSSCSLMQKLFHPQTVKGRIWEPSTWSAKLGLAPWEDLPGLEMQIKSIFLLPFSVMHPKFVIIDRTKVLLPSCNVSWEDWFEGCVELSGEIVSQFLTFWREFWAIEPDVRTELRKGIGDDPSKTISMENGPRTLATRTLDFTGMQTLFLPSPHHRNPRFAFLPWQPCSAPPATPLNTFLLAAINNAQHSIYIQTPNLTAPPVLSALLAALRRGVDITILTSEKLMVLEQLVTAGTTTARCMRKLIKLYKRSAQHGHTKDRTPSSLESAPVPIGALKISYYAPHTGSRSSNSAVAEPVQSHLKLTIIDAEWTILGSGNLDRASVFTSQELGVAFHSANFARTVAEEVKGLMRVRRKVEFETQGRHVRRLCCRSGDARDGHAHMGESERYEGER